MWSLESHLISQGFGFLYSHVLRTFILESLKIDSLKSQSKGKKEELANYKVDVFLQVSSVSF